jgi:hypothetical protein
MRVECTYSNEILSLDPRGHGRSVHPAVDQSGSAGVSKRRRCMPLSIEFNKRKEKETKYQVKLSVGAGLHICTHPFLHPSSDSSDFRTPKKDIAKPPPIFQEQRRAVRAWL